MAPLPDTQIMSPDDPARRIRVALAGNPNSGKTSIFNALTGARRNVGNYPGVTVEKRVGEHRPEGSQASFELLDLPGTYSLAAFSPEERIAEQELTTGSFDVVVVVVDSLALKRSLVLLCQVMMTGARPVLALNMSDEAERAGLKLDVEQMATLLGIPVVQTVARDGRGLKELVAAVLAAHAAPDAEHRLVLGPVIAEALQDLRGRMSLKGEPRFGPATLWSAARLLKGSLPGHERSRGVAPEDEALLAQAATWRARIEKRTGSDVSLALTEASYGFVDGLLREVVSRQPRQDARAASDAVDRVIAHRLLGLPIFMAVMYGIFWLTFSLGESPMGWIEAGFAALGDFVSGLWPAGSESSLRSLLVDGVIGGVGGVVVFLPNIVLLFLGLALLEDTGYMARAAFLMDRVMHRFGLHGRSFVPLMTGFGCSIPGIMATRTLENERDRLTTMLVLPLMSCGARLPIWLLLVPAFFPPALRAPMLWFIYAVGILLALLLALLLRRTLLAGDEAPFVMELPPYRLPTARAVVLKISERAWLYLKKAGTVILGISILMWAATTYPVKQVFDVDAQVEAGQVQLDDAELAQLRAAEAMRFSAAGRVGKAMEPVIAPLGFDWRIGTAMLGAFAAKEVFVAQMGIVTALGETDESSEGLRASLSRDYSPLVGVSLMLFLLISAPCMATIAVTRRESGSWKWAGLQLGGLTGIAYLVSLLVFQVGSFFM